MMSPDLSASKCKAFYLVPTDYVMVKNEWQVTTVDR